MSLSEQAPGEKLRLCKYDGLDNYGFRAQQLAKNSVALYGYDHNGNLCGIGVLPCGTFGGDRSNYALALNCVSSRLETSSRATFKMYIDCCSR